MMNLDFRLILASESPRRKEILSRAAISAEVRRPMFDEVYDGDMPVHEVAVWLAEGKAKSLLPYIGDKDVILAADTVVIVEGEIMGKPRGTEEARQMLSALSSKTHEVCTGCTLLSKTNQVRFHDSTEVTFRKLSAAEINFYIEAFAPFDKAGAYGIQEWLGLIGIESIHGSYFNVMGLPIHKVYKELARFTL